MATALRESELSDVVSDPNRTGIVAPESTPWFSFDGRRGSSSHEFAQRVQRIAFQHGQQRNDEWVADFAATCFSGEALEWYIGLDEETQTSWRRLRAGLIQQWPIESAQTPNGIDSAHIPTSAPATAAPHSLRRTPSRVSLGVIKIHQDGFSTPLGYVALDAAGTCIIQRDVSLALVVGRPQQLKTAAPCRMSIEGPEDVRGSIAHTPYLGLSLLQLLGKDPDTVHPEFSRVAPGSHILNPVPSSMCGIPSRVYVPPVHPLATWYISPCSEDPPGPWRTRTLREPSVPATAVFAWILDPITLELSTTWLMPDGTLHDLEIYVDNTATNPKLHMHRGRDVSGTGWGDFRVRFYFNPI